jgi:exonuclease SbcD
MRILHTGDWHLGKLVHGLHMTEDQKYILDQLKQLLIKEKVDVLIIAGDVYDRSIPPTEAVELLDDTLSEIVMSLKIKVFMIAGNHDSPDRLDFGGKILKSNGLHISGRLTKDIQSISLEDEFGFVNFYMIPYVEPALVRSMYDLDACRSHEEAMTHVMENLSESLDINERNICIGHAFVIGAENLETSDSERPLAIGGSEYVDVSLYEAFDYTALGHLHRPQKVKKETIRYAGSLLKYSFSEVTQKKSVTLIDLKEKGQIDISQHHLRPLRDLRLIKGELDDFLKEEVYTLGNREDYICAVLTDRGKLYEPMKQLRAVYPNILLLERASKLVEDNGEKDKVDIKSKSLDEQFMDFYHFISDEEVTEDEKNVFSKVYQDIRKEERAE